ncbi:MAG: hypothetical protein HRT58_19625 [Crocinitomicaceae bacterium]|nr:hypothetical protein [Flavobacteriales bacterium]NQZ37880.1 hypothetical protein [Crocinitomicaceae bacterium]
MNKALLFLLLSSAHFCFGQSNIDTTSIYYAFHGEIKHNEYIATLESPELNVLYRGYANVVTPAVQNNHGLPANVYCSGCAIIRQKDSYIVKVGRADSAIIALTLRDNDSTIPVLRKTYRVVNLPDPDLYWGNSRSGRTSNAQSGTLTAKYSEDGIALNADFSVVSWTINHNDETFTGRGDDLSIASSFLKELKGTTIIINAIVKGPDGIDRPLSGVWIID